MARMGVASSTRDDDHQHLAAGTRQVARGGLANLVGAGYSGVATFAVTVLITNIASPENAGVYFAATSILLIAVAVAQLGVPTGFVYFLAQLRALRRPEAIRPMLAAGTLPVVAFAGIIVAVVAVFRDPISHLLLGEDIDGGSTILLVLALGLLLALAAESALGATRGMGTMRPTVVADKVVNPTIQLLALVLLAAVGRTGSEDLVWTRVVAFGAMALIAIPWLMRLLRRVPSTPERSWRKVGLPSSATFAQFWRFTGPRAVGQIAQTGIQRVDIVLVALWLSPADAAIYAAATRFLVFGQLAGHAIGTAVQPRLSMLSSRGDFGSLQHLYRTSTSWIILATWPLYLTFIIHADFLMLVFGDAYQPGATILRLLSSAMLIATGCGVVDAVLLMAGRSMLTMINSWVALVLNVALNIWLIPELGILGAALAWVAAILATNVVPLIQVRWTLGVHPYGRVTLLAVAVVTLLFGALPWIVTSLGGGLLGGAISLLVAGLAYAAILWRSRRLLGLTELLRRRS